MAIRRQLRRKHLQRHARRSDVGDFTPGAFTEIHRWGVWSLVEQGFSDPAGQSFVRTFVRSPGVVAVVPLVETARGVEVVLVRQYRPALDAVLWEIPAGMRDIPDEPLEDAARRELAEETGFHGGRWDLLGSIVQSPGMTNSIVHMFVARGITRGTARPQGPEEQRMTVHTVPLAEAVRMVEGGQITNAIAVVGILRVARLV